jgi:hypothetical protein
MNDHEPAELPLWVRAIAKLANAAYDDTSTHDARRRIIAFFRAHLGRDQREDAPASAPPE